MIAKEMKMEVSGNYVLVLELATVITQKKKKGRVQHLSDSCL